MRRTVRYLGALGAVVLAGAACADGDPVESGTGDGDVVRAAIITSGPANDLAWNQGMIEGAERLEEEGLIELTVVQQDSDLTSEEIVQTTTDLAEDGYQLIVAHSFNYGEPLKTMVADYPDVLFAYAGGFGDNSENLADYDQPFFEGAFLAGILAGGVTESGVLGGTAGFDIPACHSMIEAFREGAALSYGDDVEIRPSYIGGWADAAAETREAVIALTEQGADSFVTCGVDAATIEAASQTDTYAIGYTMDQSPLAEDNVLASIVWNLDEVLRGMVEDVRSGDVNPAPYYEVGYVEGGVDVVINPNLADEIPEDVMEIFDEYQLLMADGEFEVPYIPE